MFMTDLSDSPSPASPDSEVWGAFVSKERFNDSFGGLSITSASSMDIDDEMGMSEDSAIDGHVIPDCTPEAENRTYSPGGDYFKTKSILRSALSQRVNARTAFRKYAIPIPFTEISVPNTFVSKAYPAFGVTNWSRSESFVQFKEYKKTLLETCKLPICRTSQFHSIYSQKSRGISEPFRRSTRRHIVPKRLFSKANYCEPGIVDSGSRNVSEGYNYNDSTPLGLNTSI